MQKAHTKMQAFKLYGTPDVSVATARSAFDTGIATQAYFWTCIPSNFCSVYYSGSLGGGMVDSVPLAGLTTMVLC